MNRNWLLLFLTCLLLLPGLETLAQCPNCRAAVESGLKSGSTNVGKGLNQGILYLLVLPYLIAGIIGYLWYRGYKSRQA